jgi:hypothetical protein
VGRNPLRGRGKELAGALGVLRSTMESKRGSVIAVTGEPGIGKSALLREIIGQATRLGYRVGSGEADATGRIAPGGPLLVALRSGARPLLDTEAFTGLTQLHDQHLWLVDRIAGLIEALASEVPVLIAVDDTQWADRLSSFALRMLSARLAAFPVIWLFGTRDLAAVEVDDPTVAPTDCVRVHRIDLGPLDPADEVAIADDVLGRVPSERSLELLRGAAGNPRLIMELLDALLRSGDDPGPGDVPAGFVTTVRRRLGELPPGPAVVLRVAAVLGRSLDIEALGSLARDALPGEDQAPSATPSGEPGWVREGVDQGWMIRDGNLLGFRYELVREGVYADLAAPERRALHRRCAEYHRERPTRGGPPHLVRGDHGRRDGLRTTLAGGPGERHHRSARRRTDDPAGLPAASGRPAGLAGGRPGVR